MGKILSFNREIYLGVEFIYNPLTCNWESVDSEYFGKSPDEVYRLKHCARDRRRLPDPDVAAAEEYRAAKGF